MFARLSVFPGDFSLEAAEKICDATMDTLEALVDSSLLQPAGEGRFRMLEIVRQRAAEYLVDAGGTRRSGGDISTSSSSSARRFGQAFEVWVQRQGLRPSSASTTTSGARWSSLARTA